MRPAVIAGVLGAILPTLALAQARVELGDGVSVVFPSPPMKTHTTIEAPAQASGPETMLASRFASSDSWSLRKGGANFSAISMSPRDSYVSLPTCKGPPMPVNPNGPPPNCRRLERASSEVSRRVSDDGAVTITRSVQSHGRNYMVTFRRPGPEMLAKLTSLGETPSESDGQAFVDSLKVGGPAS